MKYKLKPNHNNDIKERYWNNVDDNDPKIISRLLNGEAIEFEILNNSLSFDIIHNDIEPYKQFTVSVKDNTASIELNGQPLVRFYDTYDFDGDSPYHIEVSFKEDYKVGDSFINLFLDVPKTTLLNILHIMKDNGINFKDSLTSTMTYKSNSVIMIIDKLQTRWMLSISNEKLDVSDLLEIHYSEMDISFWDTLIRFVEGSMAVDNITSNMGE